MKDNVSQKIVKIIGKIYSDKVVTQVKISKIPDFVRTEISYQNRMKFQIDLTSRIFTELTH